MNDPMPLTDHPQPLGRISHVSIRGFRSLRQVDGLSLPPLAVLIGANGSGKSTLLKFFEMLGWMLQGPRLQEFVLRHGGGDDQFFMGARQTPMIQAEIRVTTSTGCHDYRFSLEHLSVNDTVMVKAEAYRSLNLTQEAQAPWQEVASHRSEAGLAAESAPAAKALCHLLRQCAIYQFHDTSDKAAIRLRWDVTDSVRLRSDGGNLAPVLLALREHRWRRYQLVVRQIRRVLPTFKDFVLEPHYGKVDLRWVGLHSDKVFGPHLTSDGSLRLFCLLTLLNLPMEQLPDVMFFDEPELGLHPHAITLVAEMLKRLAQTRQIFIATQSPEMVDCFALDNILVASANDGATLLRNLSPAQYQHWLDDEYRISDLWLKQAVGGLAWLGEPVQSGGCSRGGRGGGHAVIRVCVVCEGATEVEFVNQCLEPYLRSCGIHAYGTVLSARSGRHRGGRVTVDRLAEAIAFHCSQSDRVSSLVDFYGFQDRMGRNLPAMWRPTSVRRWLCGQPCMNFGECCLTCRCMSLRRCCSMNLRPLPGWRMVPSDEVDTALRAVVRSFASPEDINDSPQTAPIQADTGHSSKGGRLYSKTEHGPLHCRGHRDRYAIRAKCPAFDAWMGQLQVWGQS